jgi:hypothetical protein
LFQIANVTSPNVASTRIPGFHLDGTSSGTAAIDPFNTQPLADDLARIDGPSEQFRLFHAMEDNLCRQALRQ